MNNSSPRLIKITIKNKQEIIFDDFARALSSSNELGVFDILPMHENFISIIKDTIIVHKANGESQQIEITKGVLKASENKVNVYLGLLS